MPTLTLAPKTWSDRTSPTHDLGRRLTGLQTWMPYHGSMPELVFEVVQESDGGYCAECLTESIFTEGDTWDELRKNVLEATSAFFFDRPRPERVRLHLVRDEVLRGKTEFPSKPALFTQTADQRA